MPDEYQMYKISVFPFSKAEAKQISTYLSAFVGNKTVEIEGIHLDGEVTNKPATK